MIKCKIITWQPVLTDHQAFTYQALANLSECPVIAYVSSIEDNYRKKQGWGDTTVNTIERIVIPKYGFLLYFYRNLIIHKDSVHIFASPFQEWRLIICLLFAVILRVEFYLISEPYSIIDGGYLAETNKILGKLKATFRPFIYRIYAILIRSRVKGIFTISDLSYTQYLKLGVAAAKLFPFGYFIPKIDSFREDPNGNHLIKLVFIGSLIHRKGLDILIGALERLKNDRFEFLLDIYGPGDISQYYFDNDFIKYRGVISFGLAQSVIRNYNLLVLPSRFDGWGVVVNEAVCVGVPVITSDATGAGVVAHKLGAGLCFKSGDINALYNTLKEIYENRCIIKSLSLAAKKSSKKLQPDIAAKYLLDVITIPELGKQKVTSIFSQQ